MRGLKICKVLGRERVGVQAAERGVPRMFLPRLLKLLLQHALRCSAPLLRRLQAPSTQHLDALNYPKTVLGASGLKCAGRSRRLAYAFLGVLSS